MELCHRVHISVEVKDVSSRCSTPFNFLKVNGVWINIKKKRNIDRESSGAQKGGGLGTILSGPSRPFRRLEEDIAIVNDILTKMHIPPYDTTSSSITWTCRLLTLT